MSIDFIRPEVDELRPRISVIGVGGAGFSVVCPGARLREFTFTSGSDAV